MNIIIVIMHSFAMPSYMLLITNGAVPAVRVAAAANYEMSAIRVVQVAQAAYFLLACTARYHIRSCVLL